MSLGKFAFTTGGAGQEIILSDNANGAVVADAVKLVRDNAPTLITRTRTSPTITSPKRQPRLGGRPECVCPDRHVRHHLRRAEPDRQGGGEDQEHRVKNTTSFTYDENANVITRTHDTTWSKFDYDVRDLLATVTNAASASAADKRVTTYTYTPRVRVGHQVKPNGNTVDFTYHLDGAVQHQVEKRAGGAIAAEHTLDHTLNGDPAKDVAKVMNADNNAATVDSTYPFT